MNPGISKRITAVSLLLFVSLISAQSSVSSNDLTTLTNTNPDPSGEPWIAGGINFEEWNSAVENSSPMPLAKIGAATATPPSKVDNTTNAAFRPIFNQKGGSCAQASGIAYQYTYEINTLRNLPSNVLKNQYPYDFTYNFLNAGSGDRGSISTDGWSIVKAIGVPDAETYGGFGLGVYSHWLSGYDAYFKGMANRLESSFGIKIRVAADILKMKQFLFDHSNGSTTGGILNYASDVTGIKLVSLATGTPDAGKKAIVSFGTTGGHAMSIAGYNDSIRYDFNGDGRFTNDVDINKDGVVDVRDWEIGAALMVNSWGTTWGNSGKAYLMYKLLADDKSVGGIWTNTVSGITITNATVTPKLTYKVRMSYNPRSSIRIKAGYSTNASATTPTATKTFSKAFNLAGGAFPMQGNNTNVIEIGLDISDFVPKITTSEAAFFLQIESSSGSGTIEQFSMIDYSSGLPVETVCQTKNATVATGTTTLKIVKTSAPLLVVSPNGGEEWERSRTFNIVWTTKDTSSVVIELLKAGALQSTIASSAPATGTYAWNIPTSITPAADYTIRIRNKTTTTMTDVSDKSFSIEDLSQLELVTPNAKEYLLKGGSSTITWKSNVTGWVKIDLYRHGVFEMKIDSALISSSSYTWKVPSTISSGFDYRIRITSKDKDWLFDESDIDFGIGYAPVSAPYTQTFDNFPAGEPLSSSWEQSDDDDINWTILKGPTPSKTNPQAGGTGPNGDHTNGSGMYLYVEASTPNNPGKDAVVLSPLFNIKDLPDAQVSFWCHMFSREKRIGQLWIDVNTDGHWNDSVIYLTGDHEDKWFQQSIDLTAFKSSQVQLRFRVLTGTDYDGDICIDDFAVTGAGTPIALSPKLVVQSSIQQNNNLIKFSGYSGQVKIFTLSGKKVIDKSITLKEENIDISNFPRGMYMLIINDKSLSFVRH